MSNLLEYLPKLTKEEREFLLRVLGVAKQTQGLDFRVTDSELALTDRDVMRKAISKNCYWAHPYGPYCYDARMRLLDKLSKR